MACVRVRVGTRPTIRLMTRFVISLAARLKVRVIIGLGLYKGGPPRAGPERPS